MVVWCAVGGGVDHGRGIARLIHICLGEIDLLGEVLELDEDLFVIGEPRLVSLVGCLLARTEAVDDRLQQVLQLVDGLRHRVENAAGLRQGFGRRRGLAPNQPYPKQDFVQTRWSGLHLTRWMLPATERI